MSDLQQGYQQGASDVVIQLRGIVQQLSAWVLAFQGRVTSGMFTLGAAATTTVPQAAVKANSIITITASNAAAATLMGGTKSLYVSTITPGTSFAVTTASGVAAAGTETFSYSIFSPS